MVSDNNGENFLQNHQNIDIEQKTNKTSIRKIHCGKKKGLTLQNVSPNFVLFVFVPKGYSKVVLHHSADAVVDHLAQVVVVGDGAVDLKVAVGDGGQLVFKADVESLGVVTY